MSAHDGDATVVIEAGGDVHVEGTVSPAAGRWQWLGLGTELALLTRPRTDEERPRLLMAGEIVARTTVLEVVSMLAQSGWQGELGVHCGRRSRYLSIADGTLRAARSTLDAERLGAVMVGMDLLTHTQLQACVNDADKDRRLGELALRHRYVTEERLYAALRTQVQRIFQNALLEEAGHYALVQLPEDEASAPAFTQEITLQELLMDSVRRIDEMTEFRKRIAHASVCPVLKPNAAAQMAAGEALSALADGKHTIAQIARALHSDEYEVTKRVYHLLQVGAVELQDQSELDREQALRMVTRFNQLHTGIFDAVHQHGNREALYRVLTAWIAEGPLTQLFGGLLAPEGCLDAPRVIDRMPTYGREPPLTTLHKALQELAAFSMLSAGSMLPRNAERSLSQTVRRKLAQLRRADD